MRWSLLILVFVAAGQATAQYVKLPTEVRGEPSTFLTVKADTDCGTLRWFALDAGLSLVPPEILKDSRTAVVMAGRVGRFRVLAYGAKGGDASEPAVCVVVVGEPGPTPPPVPPVPPPKPEPTDAFYQAMKKAWLLDAGTNRVADKQRLASFYRGAAEVALRPEPKTVGGLFAVLREASAKLFADTALKGVRDVIAAEFRATLPAVAASEIAPAMRPIIAEKFRQTAAYLELLP